MLKTKYTVQYDEPRLLIRFQSGLPGRWAGGVLLAAATSLLWHLVMGIVDSIRYHEMLLVFPGTLLLIVMILALGVPGWVMVFLRKHTLIDPVEREVVDVKDFLVYRQTKRYPLEVFDHVRVSREVRRQKDSEHRTERVYVLYPVELWAADEVLVLVAEMDSVEEGRDLAEQIASRLGLPWEDHTEGTAEDADDEES